MGNKPTQDHFSKVSIHNFSGLKKYKKRVYRNDRKNLPWDFWEVSWVGLFPTTNDITSNTKSFENYKKITDTIKSKLTNRKYAISNVVMRKDKPDIEKKVIEFNSRPSKFCIKNKIDIIENENLDGSYLSFKKLHLNKKGHSY